MSCFKFIFLTDECSKLPDIDNLGTAAEFPVIYNAPVTVQCDVGYSLMGHDVITCIRGDNYRSIYGQLPSCTESESEGVLLISLTSHEILISLFHLQKIKIGQHDFAIFKQIRNKT